MLQCEDCRRHEYGGLLAVARRLEGCTYRHLGLAEAYVATYKPIHRLGRLHIALYGGDGCLLVGRILPLKRGLKLLLQISIRGEGKALRGLTLGVQRYKLARYILYGALCRGLELLPSAIAQFVNLRRLALATLVSRDAVQRVNIDKEYVVILVYQLDSLLCATILLQLDKASEAAHAVVNVHHVVAHLKGVKLGDGHLLVALYLATYAVALVAIEDLMVGIEADLKVVVDETLVKYDILRAELHGAASHLVKDIRKSLYLSLVVREYRGGVAALAVPAYVVGQHLEVAVEGWLRLCVEGYGVRSLALADVVAAKHQRLALKLLEESLARGDALRQALGILLALGRLQYLLAYVGYLTQYVVAIGHPPRSFSCEGGQRDTLRRARVAEHIRYDVYLVGTLGRELARDVETTQGVYDVAEEVNTIGLRLYVREYIHESSSYGVLSWLVDKVYTRKVVGCEPLYEARLLHRVAHG